MDLRMDLSIEEIQQQYGFRIDLLNATPNPQQLAWLAAHTCVCESDPLTDRLLDERKAGIGLVRNLLQGGKGHYSPLEAPQINFLAIGFNHRTMQQITRHRVGVHFSVQSLRYTSQRFVDWAEKLRVAALEHGLEAIFGPTDIWDVIYESGDSVLLDELEELVYLRPVGEYRDRKGKQYQYSEKERVDDLLDTAYLVYRYANKIRQGYAEEQAAGLLPMDTRQNWAMSFNVRSLMHILDLRAKADAQLEIRLLCELIRPHFESWAPELAYWYCQKRWGKALLAP